MREGTGHAGRVPSVTQDCRESSPEREGTQLFGVCGRGAGGSC